MDSGVQDMSAQAQNTKAGLTERVPRRIYLVAVKLGRRRLGYPSSEAVNEEICEEITLLQKAYCSVAWEQM